ncbi:hypothetical protein [Actinoplanes sp. NPDC026619]|uniref:hypothetical protein n=1 Tax=Actinoplanes sp. NPDC026619 TaxID=3155798 RepID=UPI0033E7CC30
MTVCTQEQAWRLIRALGPVNAGRLVGHSLIGHVPHLPAGTLTPHAAQVLHDNLYRPPDLAVTGDSICYVVCSDHTPIAWLTYHAQVVTPAAQLTAYQLEHQGKAVAALSQLTRRAIGQLARLRDQREGRGPGAEPDVREQTTRVLVANPTDPTLTWWTSLSPDLDASRAHLAALTRTSGDDALVVDAFGYGAYQRGSHPLTVPVLCTIERLAAEHTLAASVIGDWLDAEGAPRSRPDATEIEEAFTACYLGLYPYRRAFAEAERDRRGWRHILDAAGIPLHLFDLHRYAADLFADDVRSITLTDGRLAVFRRPTG